MKTLALLIFLAATPTPTPCTSVADGPDLLMDCAVGEPHCPPDFIVAAVKPGPVRMLVICKVPTQREDAR